jgi:uncharacterized protein
MRHFFYKLIPPRPTFPMDITEAEGAIMQDHIAYWSRLISERKVVAYGPVMDPQGTYGVAIVEVEDLSNAQNIADDDPAIKSKAGFAFEIHSMPNAQVRS